MSINIVIADDHKMVREGLIQLLEFDSDIRVIGEASDGEECIELLKTVVPDVLLLDINMPKYNGIQVLEKLRDLKSDIKVLILTIHNEIEYLIKAVDIGVKGYVLKDSDSNILKQAIYAVYSGESYIQPSLNPQLKDKVNLRAVRKANQSGILTNRELEVLELVAGGLLNKEIAYTLNISEKTVKNHVSNIFKKINVSDRTQAAVYAIKNNIIDLI